MVARRVGPFFATRRLEREQCFFSHASNFSRVQKSKGQFTRCDLSARFVGHDKSESEAVYVQCKHCTCIFYSQTFFIKRLGKQNGR